MTTQRASNSMGDSTWDFSTGAVGSDVVVSNGHYSPRSLHKVAKINKTKVTLDDGSEWTMRGRQWGNGRGSWNRRHAWLITDFAAVSREVAEERASYKLDADRGALRERLGREAKLLSAEHVAAINAILDSAKAQESPADEREGRGSPSAGA